MPGERKRGRKKEMETETKTERKPISEDWNTLSFPIAVFPCPCLIWEWFLIVECLDYMLSRCPCQSLWVRVDRSRTCLGLGSAHVHELERWFFSQQSHEGSELSLRVFPNLSPSPPLLAKQMVPFRSSRELRQTSLESKLESWCLLLNKGELIQFSWERKPDLRFFPKFKPLESSPC